MVERFVHRETREVVDANLFVATIPTTHWHVNLGHPTRKELAEVFYVNSQPGSAGTNSDVALINDGEWVVLTPGHGLSVWPPDLFRATFEPVSDYE